MNVRCCVGGCSEDGEITVTARVPFDADGDGAIRTSLGAVTLQEETLGICRPHYDKLLMGMDMNRISRVRFIRPSDET